MYNELGRIRQEIVWTHFEVLSIQLQKKPGNATKEYQQGQVISGMGYEAPNTPILSSSAANQTAKFVTTDTTSYYQLHCLSVYVIHKGTSYFHCLTDDITHLKKSSRNGPYP